MHVNAVELRWLRSGEREVRIGYARIIGFGEKPPRSQCGRGCRKLLWNNKGLLLPLLVNGASEQASFLFVPRFHWWQRRNQSFAVWQKNRYTTLRSLCNEALVARARYTLSWACEESSLQMRYRYAVVLFDEGNNDRAGRISSRFCIREENSSHVVSVVVVPEK